MRVASSIPENNSPAPELLRGLAGNSPAIERVRQLVSKVAPTSANVLILGESGTGKEVVARNIHRLSLRRDRPFVPINCGAIPRDLLESELFGHEKGAFTGAITARQGRFEMADGGTLFLDEIGDMAPAMQVKLLRVLQERCFERVGGSRTLHADVRIVAATHHNLEQSIKDGTFREDLYYRLNVFPIEMPSLRQRRMDISPLVHEQLQRRRQETGVETILAPDALAALQAYVWPGNVRELGNLIERLTIMFPRAVVRAADLPEKYRIAAPVEISEMIYDVPSGASASPLLPPEGLDLKAYLHEIEVGYIQQAMEETGGVVTHAAERLGLRRTTLVEKLRKFGMTSAATDEMIDLPADAAGEKPGKI